MRMRTNNYCEPPSAGFRHPARKANSMLLLIIILVLLFGGGGGYYGYSRWGYGGGLGILGTVLLIVLVLYLLGGLGLR